MNKYCLSIFIFEEGKTKLEENIVSSINFDFETLKECFDFILICESAISETNYEYTLSSI